MKRCRSKVWNSGAHVENSGVCAGKVREGVSCARRSAILNAAPSLDTPRSLSSNRLKALRGDRPGYHSIRINRQWWLYFESPEGQAGLDKLEIVDYHG
ncbi:MAG: type II toxin-antitoxin system RelE/ParE family toxin [Alphaproteobacteria bacterium]|nr:type II toxin-antitoxin system RelE/ParE family toxin [Alphaproteobacteria bacterium]